MLITYGWDEVSGEVTEERLDLPTDAKTQEVVKAWPGSTGDEVWCEAQVSNMTLVAGRFGQNKQFMMWWGDDRIAKMFAEVMACA